MVRIGLNIHTLKRGQRPYSAEEKMRLFTWLENARPSAVLVLDDDGWAREIKRLLPECRVVIRKWHGDDGRLHLTMAPQAFVDAYAKAAEGGLILNVLNEPNGYSDLPRLAGWCADVLTRLGQRGIMAAAPNFGVGHPDLMPSALNQLKPLFEILQTWRHMHFLGLHEYWTHTGYDLQGRWRVGRFTRLAEWLTANNYAIPNILITEWGIDSALDGTPQRGWRDSRTEQQYAKECNDLAAWYSQFPQVQGLCVFSYGNTGKIGTGDDWSSFDVSDAEVFLNSISLPVPPAETNTPPGQYILRTASPTGTVNVRPTPSTTGAPVMVLRDKQNLTVRDAKPASGSGYTWLPVLVDNREGWIAVLPAVYTLEKPAPPPPPPPPPNDETKDWGQEMSVMLEALIRTVNSIGAALNELRADLEQQLQDLKDISD